MNCKKRWAKGCSKGRKMNGKNFGSKIRVELKVRIREKEERDRGKKPFIKSSFEEVGHEFYHAFTDYDDLLI